MWYTERLNYILEQIKEVDSLLKEERESDNDDNAMMRFLVNKKSWLITDRDLLILQHKNGKTISNIW